MTLGWLTEAWDRLVASDPGLGRLRMAASAAVAMGSAIGVEYAFAKAVHADSAGTLTTMMLGAVVSMMGSMALGGPGVWTKVKVGVFFPVAFGSGMTVGALVGGNQRLMLAVFVLVMFAAVAVRRFGAPFFFYGFMGWMGYFFASFLGAVPAKLPGMLAAVGVGTAWVILLSVTVLRTNASRTLRRTVRAFDARARAVARASADLLRAAGAEPRQHARLRRRLHARQTRLAEAALMVEGWSAEEGSVPSGRSAAALRRRLIDAQQLLDRQAAAAEALAVTNAALAAAAAVVAERLARRDDAGAARAARALAETAEHAPGTDPEGTASAGWWPARHYAAAVLDFTALVREVGARPSRSDEAMAEAVDEFEPVVALAMGNLPGSVAVAQNVPARTRRWNPLARLDLTTRQAIQAAVAGALAILAGRELSPVRYYWAVLAAFIMFTGTATRSESFLKGFNRVLGTLFGLFVSIGVAYLTAGHLGWVLGTIVASMFCGFYLMRVSYAYMIFFITIMLGQLYTALHQLSFALLMLRLEETAVGAAVGLLVSFAVLPVSTRDTVRAARDNLLSALADLLTAAAHRLDGGADDGTEEGTADGRTDGAPPAREAQETPEAPADLDALSRTLDHRLIQLALVAKPLTRPLIWGNSPPRTRHRLALYGAVSTHARALAVALRHHETDRTAAPAMACRALAAAVLRLTETPPGKTPPTAEDGLLAQADTALFALTHDTADSRATDPVLRALIHIQQLLREITMPPARHGRRRGDGKLSLAPVAAERTEQDAPTETAEAVGAGAAGAVTGAGGGDAPAGGPAGEPAAPAAGQAPAVPPAPPEARPAGAGRPARLAPARRAWPPGPAPRLTGLPAQRSLPAARPARAEPVPPRPAQPRAVPAPRPAASGGRPAATLTGGFATPDGRPVPRGVLVLIDHAGHRAARLTTDDQGRFRVEGAAPGGYVVLATAPGHQPAVAHVQLHPGRVQQANLTLPTAPAPRPAAPRGVPAAPGQTAR